MKEKKGLTTAQVAVLMAALTGLSKVMGFVREVIMANYFGAGMVTDSYVMALSIPSTLLTAFISAVAISYMPMFSKKMETEGEESANRLTSQLLNFLFSIISAGIVLGLIFARPIVKIFAPGFGPQTLDLTVFFLRIAFFTLYFVAAKYIFGAYLNYKNVFVPQVVYGFLQGILLIVFVVISAKVDYRLLIFGSLLGGIFVAIPHVTRSMKAGFKYSADFNFTEPVRGVMTLALPIFLGGYVNQFNLAIDKNLASALQNGSVSSLNYANQIITAISDLTVMIFITILYPKLNKAFVQGDYQHMSDLSERGINLIALISTPCALGLIFYAKPVISFVFERGAFDATASGLTSSALIYYAIGLVFLSVNQLITKVYYSMHDTKTAVKCSALAVSCNIVLNFILVGPMKHAGLALATSIAQILNTALLGYTFTRRYPRIKLISSPRKLIQIALISVLSVGISFAVYTAAAGSLGSIIALLIAIVVAVVLYMAALVLLKFEELNLLLDLIRR